MNPPFTSRKKMGEKFTDKIREGLRKRIDYLHGRLISCDNDLKDFADKNSIEPLFTALADACVDKKNGIIAMVLPTIALTAASSSVKRKILAERFHIHTIVTCHQIGNMNMSQNSSINESILIIKKDKNKESTRVINLDRLPNNESEVNDLCDAINTCNNGNISNGWGVVSDYKRENIEKGNWSACCIRNSELINSVDLILNNKNLIEMGKQNISCNDTRSAIRKSDFLPCVKNNKNSFPVLDSSGSGGQKSINPDPDSHWMPINPNSSDKEKLLNKSGYLLLTAGQRTTTSRLTAVAGDIEYVGRGWLPVSNINTDQSKGMSVFLNSTIGRLQFLRIPGRTLDFPLYNPAALKGIMVPDLKNDKIYKILEKCWEKTKNMGVPQYRDGECEVRQLWDKAVCDALKLDYEHVSKLRNLLHEEPIVKGVSHGHYKL